MSDVDLEAIRGEWVGVEFDQVRLHADADRMVAWAEACGETDPRFVDPSHSDFQAVPNFITISVPKRVLPEDFPQFGSGFGIDGGKTVHSHLPIRVGDELSGMASILDVFDKTGRSGTMYFIVQRMTFTNQDGEVVGTVDNKMIRGA